MISVTLFESPTAVCDLLTQSMWLEVNGLLELVGDIGPPHWSICPDWVVAGSAIPPGSKGAGGTRFGLARLVLST